MGEFFPRRRAPFSFVQVCCCLSPLRPKGPDKLALWEEGGAKGVVRPGIAPPGAIIMRRTGSHSRRRLSFKLRLGLRTKGRKETLLGICNNAPLLDASLVLFPFHFIPFSLSLCKARVRYVDERDCFLQYLRAISGPRIPRVAEENFRLDFASGLRYYIVIYGGPSDLGYRSRMARGGY